MKDIILDNIDTSVRLQRYPEYTPSESDIVEFERSLGMDECSHCLFTLFAINLFLFPKIILNGYMLDGFAALSRKNESSGLFRRFRFEFAYSLLFTLLLFWIVSIDRGKLKIKTLGIAFWIMFQYIISLLILTFIVKSIFQ